MLEFGLETPATAIEAATLFKQGEVDTQNTSVTPPDEINLELQAEQFDLKLPDEQNNPHNGLAESPEQTVLFSSDESSPFNRGRYWRIQRNRQR